MGTSTLSKRRVPDDLFRTWIHPLRHNRKIRRDFDKYLRTVPKPKHLLDRSNQQRTFAGPVLIVWARHDKLMPSAHTEQLAEQFRSTHLVWIDDNRTPPCPTNRGEPANESGGRGSGVWFDHLPAVALEGVSCRDGVAVHCCPELLVEVFVS